MDPEQNEIQTSGENQSPTQEAVLNEILKSLTELKNPQSLSPIVVEGRLSRIETKLDDLISAVNEDRKAGAKQFDLHERDIRTLRKGYWASVGGLGVLSFVSPFLVKALFRI